MAPEDWAKDFFSGLFVDFWLANAEHRTPEEVDFIEDALGVPAGANILDLACGPGRHCLELAERGYRMTGVDIAPAFLTVARAAALKRGLGVTWEERPLCDLPWKVAFDGAICMGNSLWCADDAALVAFFRTVAQTLKPASRFVLVTEFVAESVLPNLKVRDWTQVADILGLAHRRYDPAMGRLDIEFTLIRGDRIETKSGFGQVHTYKEFCCLIEAAGFRIVDGYASAAKEPYRLGSPELFLVAEKRQG